MKPTVGRIVRFNAGDGHARAALVTYVHSATCVNLAVFDLDGEVDGESFVTEGTGERQWGWPPMQPPAPARKGPTLEELAALGYSAYGSKAGWRAYNGEPMPAWAELPDHIQARWAAATQAIVLEVLGHRREDLPDVDSATS